MKKIIIYFIAIVFSLTLVIQNVQSSEKSELKYRSKDTLVNSKTKVIGIIGGLSWVSSMDYYKQINEMMRDRYGDMYSGNILMYSIPFHEFSAQERLALQGDWSKLTELMIDAAKRLENGGADFFYNSIEHYEFNC